MAAGQALSEDRHARALDRVLEIFGAGTLVVEAAYGGGRDPATAGGGDTAGDRAILEVEFIPTGNVLSLQVLVARRDGAEITGWMLDDVLSFRMNGTLVTAPILNAAHVNGLLRAGIPMRGRTLTLNVAIPVKAGEVNALRIGEPAGQARSPEPGITAGLAAARTELIGKDGAVAHLDGLPVTLDALSGGGLMSITHIDGTGIATAVAEPSVQADRMAPEVIARLHLVPSDGCGGRQGGPAVAADCGTGIIDAAFALVSAVPCFARGTAIRTPGGERPIEQLARGDMVETRDAGPQPVRWVGTHRVAARDGLAPVVIEAGAFGRHGRLVVAPLHRIHPKGRAATMPDGAVAARELVDGASVRIEEGGEVEYFHLLFDERHVVWAAGLEAESFLPGPGMSGASASGGTDAAQGPGVWHAGHRDAGPAPYRDRDRRPSPPTGV
jgi:hypothetical protein